jgi:hypothetical protein
MRVVLCGGTGFVGRHFMRRLLDEGHEVAVLTRHPGQYRAEQGITYSGWDSLASGPRVFERSDAVINLAGESLAGGRWTRARRERLLLSRTASTGAIVEAMRTAAHPPPVLLNISAVGFYGDTGTEIVTEQHEAGRGFLAEVCLAWEAAALKAVDLGIRVVIPRMGVVLGRPGGALDTMALLFRVFLGGTPGSGAQYVPWIHLDDAVDAALFSLRDGTMRGPVNLVAPESVTMREFSRALGSALHRPSLLPVPAFVLRGLLGEMAVMILASQRVTPSALIRNGFRFRFPSLQEALRSLFGNKEPRPALKT